MSQMILTKQNEEFLEKHLAHYGVKGMRWGVRRKRNSSAKAKKSVRDRFKIKPYNELTELERSKRAAKIIAAILVADFATAKIHSYIHPKVRGHNKQVLKNKTKKAVWDFSQKVKATKEEKARREATIKLMANAKSGVAEAIQYIDATFK